MPYRHIRFEPDDVEDHSNKWGEGMTDQAVTIRMEDGTEVEGHAFMRGEDMTDLEVDEAQGNMLHAATERGELIYVRFPNGEEVTGRGYEGEDTAGEDVEGHGGSYR